MSTIIAGIVTFNPDLNRLIENINAVHPQVDAVIIADNGSSNSEQIERLCKSNNIILLSNPSNEGIACALNQIFYYAQKTYGSEVYVLTLDQDSIVFPDIIKTYEEYLNLENVVSYTCLREDRNYKVKELNQVSEYEYVSKCITSGNLVKMSIWEQLSGFNEKLFIDMVDSEFCYRINLAGYKILQVNKVEIIHELGDAFNVKFLGKQRTILNHSVFRRYYIFRNTVFILRKYKIAHRDYSYFELFKSLLGILFYEKDKMPKIKRSITGLIDGFRMK